MSRKSTEQYKESFSSDSLRVLFCERDLREHPERRAQQTIDGENSVGRNYTRQSTTRRSRIQNEETQDMHYLSHNESLDLRDNN